MLTSEREDESRRQELAGMEPWGLLDYARGSGLSVYARGDRLVVRGPPTADRDLVQVLLDRKAELMPLLVAGNIDERARFEERAAIAEYEGGLSRAEAEQLAQEEIQALRATDSLP